MLVLSRKAGESFVLTVPGLSQPIWVTISEVKHGSVRVGFEAPQEVRIARAELLAAGKGENK